MSFWIPNRRQWWVIWTAYVLALLINGDYLNANTREGVSRVTVFLVIGAMLLVWRLQGRRADEAVAPSAQAVQSPAPHERVATFLRSNKPAAYCDSCISAALGFAKPLEAKQATGRLASASATRAERESAACAATPYW